MDFFTLPRLLVIFFTIFGALLVFMCFLLAKKAMSASKDRSQYKSKKIVKKYYEDGGKQIKDSTISGQLIKRWKENSQSWKDFLE